MQREEINNLIRKYLDGSATDQERSIVLEWYRDQNTKEVTWELENEGEELFLQTRMLNNIQEEIATTRSIRFKKLYRIAAAASVLLLISTSLYFIMNKPAEEVTTVKEIAPRPGDVAPGTNKAILTLADGSKISLDDATNGQIALESGIKIVKTTDGQLVYTISPTHKKDGTVQLNTISTPRGGQYRINLPDGSKVWLNAASSLTYPTIFAGNERKVKLAGEAYFEISHNKSAPFRVESNNQVVEVLGTHFNINSYTNEPVTKTTLLEGSVKVIPLLTHLPSLLKPGQEANLSVNGTLALAQADTLQAVSWKNGDFLFNDTPLFDIMRQLERWYDVNVDYSNIPQTRYYGTISRSVNLSNVLKMLEVTGPIKFNIEGKAIKITKNIN